jgi:hypothetical protein
LGGHTNSPPAGSKLPYLTATILNNTIVAGLNYTIFNYFASASYDANMTVRNNILDGATPAGQDFGYIAGGTPVADHNLVSPNASAQYTSPATGDFTLKATSTAIDKGVPIAGITEGFVGTAPDEGAYESGQPAWKAGSTISP